MMTVHVNGEVRARSSDMGSSWYLFI